MIKKEKNVNNKMPIIIELVENTKFKIQMWIMKITYKFYIHKTREHKLLKVQIIRQFKMLKTKTTNRTLSLNVG
jgi:hypothetical protein